MLGISFEKIDATCFLEGKKDVELLALSSLEVETKLVGMFCARPSGRLIDKISSAWGLSPWLQTELFIFASILDRIDNDISYSLLPTRRKRLILAFERSIREMDRLRESIVNVQAVKGFDAGQDNGEPLRASLVVRFHSLVDYFKQFLINLLSTEYTLQISFVSIKKQLLKAFLKGAEQSHLFNSEESVKA